MKLEKYNKCESMWPKYSLISDTGDMQNKDKACERADEKEKPN